MTLTSLHSLVSHKRTEVSAEFQRLNVLLLRAGTGRRIGTALLTDARVQVGVRSGLWDSIMLVVLFSGDSQSGGVGLGVPGRSPGDEPRLGLPRPPEDHLGGPGAARGGGGGQSGPDVDLG